MNLAIDINVAASECESAIISTRTGKLRRLLVGRDRHAGVVLIAIGACADISPEPNNPLRIGIARDRAIYEVKRKYGMAWWVMPLLAIIIEVIEWWLEHRQKPAPDWVPLVK